MMARKTEDNSIELVVFGGYGAPQKDTLPGNSIHRTNEVHTFNTETGKFLYRTYDALVVMKNMHSLSTGEWTAQDIWTSESCMGVG